MKKLTKYNIVINDDDETGMDFNSLVEFPAHKKDFLMFSKEKKYFLDENSKTIIGCVIAADEEIYRNSEKIGEHLVVFSKDEIKKIVVKMSKQGFFNQVNVDHDKQVDGVFMIGLFQLDSKIGIVAPEKLKSQNLKDGSLIGIYHVENQEVINKVKTGEFNGFSIEGIFEKIKLNQKNMFEKFKKSSKKENFVEATATADDGTKLHWEGELTIGETIIHVINEDESTSPSPAKSYLVSDGEMTFTITVDESGVLTDVQPVETVKAMQDEIKTLKFQLSKFNKELGKTTEKETKIDFFEMAKKIKNLK